MRKCTNGRNVVGCVALINAFISVWFMACTYIWKDSFAIENQVVQSYATSYALDHNSSRVKLPGRTKDVSNRQIDKKETTTSGESSHALNPCKKNVTSDEKLWIAVPQWTSENHLTAMLRSIANQKVLGHFSIEVVVFQNLIPSISSEVQEKFTGGQNAIQFTFRRQPAFEYILREALPHEYVFVMAEGSTLVNEKALSSLHDGLRHSGALLAWVQHESQKDTSCSNFHKKLTVSVDNSSEQPPYFCPAQVFRAGLVKSMQTGGSEDASDVTQLVLHNAKVSRTLAATNRTVNVGHQPLINYIDTPVLSMEESEKGTLNPDQEKELAKEQMYVITCVDDSHDYVTFLKRILMSQFGLDKVMNIHICNEKTTGYHDVQAAVDRLRRKESKRKFVTIHNMTGHKGGGSSRFKLANKLMDTALVDYVIMVDANQLVRTLSISKLHKARRPLTYWSWYGRNWDDDTTRFDQSIDPRTSIDPETWARSQAGISSWQYGCTGMSIIDASIFRYSQLFDTVSGSSEISDESMWLSHIVQLIPGWKIRRLPLMFDSSKQSAVSIFENSIVQRFDNLFRDVGYLRCSVPQKQSTLVALPVDKPAILPPTVPAPQHQAQCSVNPIADTVRADDDTLIVEECKLDPPRTTPSAASISTYVLNLKGREQRFETVKRLFEGTSITPNRFEAKNGDVSGRVGLPLLSPRPGTGDTVRILQPGELGYRASMRALFQQAWDNGTQHLLILDDDAVPHDDFETLFNELLQETRCGGHMFAKGSKGGVIQLGATIYRPIWSLIQQEKRLAKKIYVGPRSKCFSSNMHTIGSFAVMYSRGVFQDVIDWLDNGPLQPYDWVFGHLAEKGYPTRTTFPAIVVAGDYGVSDVNPNRKANFEKRANSSRWPIEHFSKLKLITETKS